MEEASATGLGTGPLQRQRAAVNLVHQVVSAETANNEDHTFSGVMFDIKTSDLPFEYIEVTDIWLRGDLGPITIWSTADTYLGKNTQQAKWTCHYQKEHTRSRIELKEMHLDTPIRLSSDSSKGIYVHSGLAGDDGIVYDNTSPYRHSTKDLFISITRGIAHLSNEPFSESFPSGFFGWGRGPWRMNREFVGRLSYGVRWLCWNPDVHRLMPASFRRAVWYLLLSQTVKARGRGCGLSVVDSDTLLFIINKVAWWDIDGFQEELRSKITPQKRKHCEVAPATSCGQWVDDSEEEEEEARWIEEEEEDDDDDEEEEEDEDEDEDEDEEDDL